MGRAPYEVLVFPYIKSNLRIEYAIFKRKDANYWQGIAGGGEYEYNTVMEPFLCKHM